MAPTVQPPPQRTTRRLLVCGAPGGEATLVCLLDDLAAVVERFVPAGRCAALLAELRAGSQAVKVNAPLVVAAELAGVLDDLEDLDDRDDRQGGPGGLLLCAEGKILIACTVGATLAVRGDGAVVAGPGHLELRRPGRASERLEVPLRICWTPGDVDAVLPTTIAVVWRWQVSRLVAALSVSSDAHLTWSEQTPPT